MSGRLVGHQRNGEEQTCRFLNRKRSIEWLINILCWHLLELGNPVANKVAVRVGFMGKGHGRVHSANRDQAEVQGVDETLVFFFFFFFSGEIQKSALPKVLGKECRAGKPLPIRVVERIVRIDEVLVENITAMLPMNVQVASREKASHAVAGKMMEKT